SLRLGRCRPTPSRPAAEQIGRRPNKTTPRREHCARWRRAPSLPATSSPCAASYGGPGGIQALPPVAFSVCGGAFPAIVGPSGCGKSTLLKILAGLIPATGGSALLNETPIEGPRRDIGVVFQSPVLFPWRSVLGNVLLPVDVQALGRARMTSARWSFS